MPTRRRMKSSARRAYENPSSSVTLFGILHLLYLGVLLSGLVVLFGAGLVPEYPNRWLIMGVTFMTAFLSFVLVYRIAAYTERMRLRRFGSIGLVLVIILVVLYSYLMTNYTIRLPGERSRIVISHDYTPQARQLIEDDHMFSDIEMIRVLGGNLQNVYTPSSLAAVRTIQLAIWFLLVFLCSFIFVVAIIPAKRLKADEQDKLVSKYQDWV